jgi:DNA repair protein RecO (recombination protein O)
MEWLDEAIVLSARPHGENAAVVMLLTPGQGRHAGLVAGGQGRKAQPTLQPGNRVKARWRARLADQLGTYVLEPLAAHAAAWLDHPEILAIIASACAVTEASLPERQPMPGVYAGLAILLDLKDPDLWGPSYVKWELGLLKALGYGLDLSQCAANGTADNLLYVSPRTGRAVSETAGAPYREKLLPLPGFLIGTAEWTSEDIAQGLDLTAHFLRTHVFAHPHSRQLVARDGDLPLARQRLADVYGRLMQDIQAVLPAAV